MKTFDAIGKAAVVAAFLFIGLMFPTVVVATTCIAGKVLKNSALGKKSAGRVKVINSFETPDFAYPRDVADNAEKALEKFRASGDDAGWLRALIQIYLAGNEVSVDSAMPTLKRIETASADMKTPERQLASLFAARCYLNLYNSSRWVYDRRKIPSGDIPENPKEWSGVMFRNRICDLIDSAFAEDMIWESPLSEVSAILTDTEKAGAAGMTVGDFMALDACSILDRISSGESVLPLGSHDRAVSVPGELRLRLALRMLEKNRGRGSISMLVAAVLNMAQLKGDQTESFLHYWAGELQDSPECVQIYSRLADFYRLGPGDDTVPTSLVSFYGELCAYRDRLKSMAGDKTYLGKAIKYIDSLIESYADVYVKVSCDSNIPAGENLKGEAWVCNASNINLLLFKVPDSYDAGDSYVKRSRLSGSPADVVSLSFDGNIPFYSRKSWEFKCPADGRYVVVPSSTRTLSGAYGTGNVSYQIINVSSVTLIQSSSCVGGKTENRVYAVDPHDMHPLEGVKVSFSRRRWNRGAYSVSVVSSGLTEKDGGLDAPADYDIAVAEKGKSRYWMSRSSYFADQSENVRLNASVLADLSVCHPGDSIGFAVVAYTHENQTNRMAVASGLDLRAILIDAGGQPSDTLSLRSDSFGRAAGAFRIPKDGLLGSYGIRIVSDTSRQPNAAGVDRGKLTDIGYGHFEVAEYKAPTFYVVTDRISASDVENGKLEIKGMARTYSGLPVGDASVLINIIWQPLWWRFPISSSEAEYTAETKTGSDGLFSLVIDASGLKGSGFENGVFSVVATVTDIAGETRMSVPERFSIGSGYRIDIQTENIVCIDSPRIKIATAVKDFLDNPVKKQLQYSLIDKNGGAVLASGLFESPELILESSGIPSAVCVLRVWMPGDTTVKAQEREIIFYRRDDVRPPCVTRLWSPVGEIIAPADSREVEVTVGSSYDPSWILCEISESGKGVVERRWLQPDGKNIRIKVEVPDDDSRVWVNLIGMHDFAGKQQTVVICPESASRKLLVRTETFRDNVAPGSEETWRFRFETDGKADSSVAAIGVVYDKALESVAPLNWNFNPRSMIYWRNPLQNNVPCPGSSDFGRWIKNHKAKNPDRLTLPEFQTYGLFTGGNRVMVRGTMMLTSAVVNEMKVEAEDAMEYDSAPSYNMSAKQNSRDLVSVGSGAADEGLAADASVGMAVDKTLRESECPLAVFRPDMSTDDDGIATLTFSVPDFNTTWRLCISGYDRQLYTASLSLDAVASRPVMVRVNAPRFFRVGDKAVIAATLFNNSGSETAVGGRIEIVDPVSGNVVAEKEFAADVVKASASRVVSMDFCVPAEYTVLTLRAYASGCGSSDGEQSLIGVLPSSSLVLESDPFYMAPGQMSMEMRLPEFSKEDMILLQYCDNPVWLCVTALPSISYPGSSNLLSQLTSLFANATAVGLSESFPQIREAISQWTSEAKREDSILVSNLNKDSAFKTVLLENTPFVGAADSENARMAALSTLLDPTRSGAVIATTIDNIARLQNKDGGWSWCENMLSSRFMTGRALLRLGMLKTMGYLPKTRKTDDMIASAVRYMDSEIIKDYNRDPSCFSYQSIIDYLYVRSSFENLSESSAFNRIRSKAIQEIDRNWKDYDIYDKATSAVLLWREGRRGAARMILESLRQFASGSIEQGRWFDNLGSGFSGWPRLIVTTHVLEAYAEISPDDPMVDGLRQWLVLRRQTQDWGKDSDTVEVINAILRSGRDWTKSSSPSEISIGGETVGTTSLARLTGSVDIMLKPSDVSGKQLSVSRCGNGPAWGGVICRSVRPLSEVGSVSVSGLSVEKQIVVIRKGESGTEAVVPETRDGAVLLRRGDQVRITLTIVNDNDIDYVALTDQRPACLEPVDQLSGYSAVDGIWCYRETRQTQTNIFFEFLPKGAHQIAYDCMVMADGEYTTGISTVQSQYSPLLVAHSSSVVIRSE